MEFLKKIADKFAALNKTRDPAEFNDDIATRTEWDAVSSTSANFNTHKLVDAPGYGLAYKPAKTFYFMSGIFILIGGGLAVGVVATAIREGKPIDSDILLPAVFGLLFAAIGFGIWRYARRAIVFDTANRSMDLRDTRTYFGDVHALQLVVMRGSKNRNYQINLVLRDASRVYVMNYADAATARTDAARIAEAMGISPSRIWDVLPGWAGMLDTTTS